MNDKKPTVTDAVTGRCPLCTGRAAGEKPIFLVRWEVYNGKICAEHLHSLVSQQKEEQEIGQPVTG